MPRRNKGPRGFGYHFVPEVPDGYKLVRAHGMPTLVPIREPEEPVYGVAKLTLRQIQVISTLERIREGRAKLDETMKPLAKEVKEYERK